MGHAFQIYCKHGIYIHEISMKFQGKVKLLHDTFWDVKAFATSHSLEPSTSLVDLQTLKYSFVGNIPLIIISNLSNDRSKASSKMIPPHSAI